MVDYFIYAVVFVVVVALIYLTVKYPKKIREWLVLACSEAEKLLGSGTGKLKLRYVYDLFISKYPFVAKIVSFETFSKWVDLALVEMEDLLKNKDIKTYVEGGKE